jgi:predicted metal-dependent hydrolase
MATKFHILAGNPPIEVALKRHARARRFTLRVSKSSGTVSLSMPTHAPETEALEFLAERAGWVRKHLDAAPEMQRPAIGAAFPLLGADRQIVAGPGRMARFHEGQVLMPENGRAGPLLATLLKVMAREALVARCDHHAAGLGRRFGRMTLRDTRSRWGSCSTRGDLMFSWRLIMAPPEVLDYVAAHEVAHLVQMNHSPAFWATCATLCPDYQAPRRWLKSHGSALQAWRFDSLP